MQESVRASGLVGTVNSTTHSRKRLLKCAPLVCGLLLMIAPALEAQVTTNPSGAPQNSQSTGLDALFSGQSSQSNGLGSTLTGVQSGCSGPYAASNPNCATYNPYGSGTYGSPF